MNLLQHTSTNKTPKWIQNEHVRRFSKWLEERVLTKNDAICTLRCLSKIPSTEVIKHSGYIINGVRFSTEERDRKRVTQNSGVSLVAKTMQISSAKDTNPIYSDMIYYGIIKEIWEIDYVSFRQPVFLCDRVESNNGVKVNKNGFTVVDLNRIGHRKEPFVMATHVQQVFYVRSQSKSRWSYVFATQSKDYANELQDEGHDDDILAKTLTPIKGLCSDILVDNEELLYLRENGEGIYVD